jgi:hypothetical protein
MQLGLLSVALVLLRSLPIFGKFLSTALFIVYYFRVVREAAFGSTRLPSNDGSDDVGAPDLSFLAYLIRGGMGPWGFLVLLRPVVNFALAGWLIWLPAISYILLSNDPVSALVSPLAWLFLCAGIVYYPAAIIVASFTESTFAMLNPKITLRMIFRIPGHYLLTVLFTVGIGAIEYFAYAALSGMGAALHVPVLSPLLYQFLAMVLPILGALIFGRLVYQNAEHFDIFLESELWQDEWPGAVPVGVYVAPEETTAAASPHHADTTFANAEATPRDVEIKKAPSAVPYSPNYPNPSPLDLLPTPPTGTQTSEHPTTSDLPDWPA